MQPVDLRISRNPGKPANKSRRATPSRKAKADIVSATNLKMSTISNDLISIRGDVKLALKESGRNATRYEELNKRMLVIEQRQLEADERMDQFELELARLPETTEAVTTLSTKVKNNVLHVRVQI
jgi:hypothetical protein